MLLVALMLCRSSPEGSSWQIFAGLFLLGLGWSLSAVSSSTLIADHAPLEARTDVQGAADLVMGLTAASAGGLAGLVVAKLGYPDAGAGVGAAGAGGDRRGGLRRRARRQGRESVRSSE